VSVPVILDPLPAAPPENPEPEGALQVYVVLAGTRPLVLLTGVTVKLPPEQIVEAIPVTAGIGLIVTVTVNVEPVQLPALGVTVYVAVCAVFVTMESVPVIDEPLPAAPPVNPVPVGAVHV
jgi:hypothetical protein